MKRSKLEMYIDILELLSNKGPLKRTHIMNTTYVNCTVLKEHLDFLIKEGLVEERTIGKSVAFEVTPRGVNVLKYFGELKQVSPIVEEALPSHIVIDPSFPTILSSKENI